MPQAATYAREHRVIFCGLEVLRLMAERIGNRHDVDGPDLRLVFDFMRDIGHRCLDGTEDLLRGASLEGNMANHGKARSLFDQLSGESAVDSATFTAACLLYTDLLARSIYEDRRCLAGLRCDPTALRRFHEWERQTDELAHGYGRQLRKLEFKYTSPHCI